MDFLVQIKKRLNEMEDQARLLQEMEQAGFAGGGPARRRQGGAAEPGLHRPAGSAPPELTRERSGGPRQARRDQRSLVSGEETFQTPACATEGEVQVSALAPASPRTSRLIDDLHGRLDEAFLLSEVLGPPRCVKGWDSPG